MNRERFDNLTVADLQEFVALGQEEYLHLDFKQIADPTFASRSDRKNLAAALSGFANSGGGVIVWGVEARRNSDGVDCAVKLVPVSEPAKVVSRLNQLTGEAADPTVVGVLHRKIEDESGAYLATFVPESETGPHMAKLGENRYFKRVGDSFYQMEHYDIADMFGKRRRPRLIVAYKVVGLYSVAQAVLSIRNEGRATAYAPFLAFNCEGDLTKSSWGLDGNKKEGLPVLPSSYDGLQWAFCAGMDVALHPGMERQVSMLNRDRAKSVDPESGVKITYAIACQDQPLERGTISISLEELAPSISGRENAD